MPSPVRIDWRSRFNTIIELFNKERLYICEMEVRTLLAHYNLPRYYRIRCLIILAQCEEDWYKSKVGHWNGSRSHTLTPRKHHQRCAEAIWKQMNMMWPPENPDDENHINNRLRRMLDILEEDMIADRPEDYDDMADVVVTEVEYEDSDEESLAEAVELSEEATLQNSHA
jgi:hypothetical protein